MTDELLDLVNSKLDTLKFSKKRTEEWTDGIRHQYFTLDDIDSTVSDPIITTTGKACYLIKVNDPYIKYVLSLPGKCYDKQVCPQFIFFVGTPFSDDTAITPDQASAYLMHKRLPAALKPDIKIIMVKDDKGSDQTIIRHKTDGDIARVVFPKGLTDPENWKF